jgi:hypothetical protein
LAVIDWTEEMWVRSRAMSEAAFWLSAGAATSIAAAGKSARVIAVGTDMGIEAPGDFGSAMMIALRH